MTPKDSLSFLFEYIYIPLGLELVKQLAAVKGNHIFATVRKRGSSMTGEDEISSIVPTAEGSTITIVEGIDVTEDNVGEKLIKQLNGTIIDTVIHNAGSYDGKRDEQGMNEQKLEKITMDRMRLAYEVNALGPLRIQKALLDANLMRVKDDSTNCEVLGKVAIISTNLASIDDNTSGGSYAYRSAKAAVNMIGKSMSCDLKDKNISVSLIAPGFVATEFGPGKAKMEGYGAMAVDIAAKGIISIIDSMTMDNTGKFSLVQRDSSAKAILW